jgi:hypothetical protein
MKKLGGFLEFLFVVLVFGVLPFALLLSFVEIIYRVVHEKI